MDHAQGRAFHHHLARAIMHLNFLAGLLPTHMVVNPEPHLRPLSIIPAPREAQSHHHSEGVRLTPAPAVGNSSSTPVGKSSKWGVPGPDYPRATTRITTPVPVRSKQRAHSVKAPQPKKKQRVESPALESATDPPPSCNRQSTPRSQLR